MSDTSAKAELIVNEIRSGNYSNFGKLCEICIYIPDILQKEALKMGIEKEDLWQEASVSLLNALHAYVPAKAASFKTFSSVCIKKKLISVIKSGYYQKNKAMIEYESLDNIEIVSDSNPENEVIDKDNFNTTKKIIFYSLSPFERKVLGMYIDNMSYSEIGKSLCKNEKSIGNALTRIKKKLRCAENIK